MRFSNYLKDRMIPLLIILGATLIIALALGVYKTEMAVIIAVCILNTAAVCAGYTWDYLGKRRFYRDLEEGVKSKGNALYTTEFVDRPSFSEGRLVYDSLERATKDMNDRIAEYRLASSDYQEYIETWIHEVKTPLAASRLIIENKNDPALRSLEHELDRTEVYIEQALYYARSTAVEKDYAIKQVSLDGLVKDAVKKQSRILIEEDIAPTFEGLDSTVYTDPKWLDFILGQIIGNAAKYARPHSVGHTPKLMFKAKRVEKGLDGGKVVLAITDNGIGIPAHDVGRVFEKGFTGENGRLYAKSTGIGLYLCKKLCEQMKLRIALDSTQHEGTVVTIEFPLNTMYFLE